MESKPKLKSVSKYFALTSIEHLHNYAVELQKIYNTPNKYQVIDNEIRVDTFGDPYIIMQYMMDADLEDRIKLKASFFGEILTIPTRLDEYDDIATKHWNNELKMIFVRDYTTRDKENPQIYRLVIYMIPIKGEVLDPKVAKTIEPIQEKK